MAMFENIGVFFKRFMQNDRKELLAENTVSQSKDTAKDRLHIVLMQDRANVSADFLEMMKEEIIEVIKKYIVVDESKIDVRLTNEENEDGSIGAPLLRANIPILNIRNDLKGEYMYNSATHTIENVKNDVENDENQEVKNDSENEQSQEVEQVKEENVVEELEKTETVEENKEIQDNTVEAQVEDIPTEDVQTEDAKIEDSQEEYDDELDDDVTFDDLLKAAEEEEERMKKESEEDNKKENQKEEKKVTKKSNPSTTNKKRKKTSKTKKNK